MDYNTFAALFFSVIGVIYIGLGILLLLLDRILPNARYGSRTKKTLSSEYIWYPADRVTGRDIIIAGVAILLAALGVLIFRRSLQPAHGRAILVVVLVLSVSWIVVDSLRAHRNL